MRSRIPVYCAAIALLTAANSFAADVTVKERLTKELPLEIAGTLWIDNPVGNIEIVGSDVNGLVVTALKTTTGADRAALEEGREQTVVSFEGDRNVRLIRTILPAVRTSRWSSSVSYTLRVPRTIHVRVAAKIAERIRVANINGNVTVKSFSGTIILDGVAGPSIVDTTNGRVVYLYHQRLTTNAQIQAVSANIDVYVPTDANFNWIADTLRGDVLTNLPTRAEFLGSAFRGTVNAPGGPMLSMQTLLGSIRILGNGLDVHGARSLRQMPVAVSRKPERIESKALMMRPAQRIQLPISGASFEYSTSVGDVEVGEVRGWARVQTAAGEIKLGMVYGDCFAVSLGGPLDLGDIMGTLVASTQAGDVLVRSAREGGRVFTAGGTIRVLYTGGPTVLQSGGGDIVVRQAAGPVSAETHSGDINITADPNLKTQKIEARTTQGNIIINLSPKFGADIEAVILTTDPDSNSVHSDFGGLQIKKEQVGGGKTRIRATGKLNGGGERIDLYVEDGDIHITNMTTNPVTIMSPLP
jgi:DUF4097 and DUF4098 domain-containing protein YvlB